MPYGLMLRLTNISTLPESIVIPDVKDAIGDITGWEKPGPAYVPPKGTATYLYTTTVAKSFEFGHIRGFINQGDLRGEFLLGTDAELTLGIDSVVPVSVQSDDFISDYGLALYTDAILATGSITVPWPNTTNGTVLISAPAAGDIASRTVNVPFFTLEQNPILVARARITGVGPVTDAFYAVGTQTSDTFGGAGFVIAPAATGNLKWNAMATYGAPPGPGFNAPVDGNWHTFMFTATTTEMRYFYDGALIGVRDITGIFPPNMQFWPIFLSQADPRRSGRS